MKHWQSFDHLELFAESIIESAADFVMDCVSEDQPKTFALAEHLFNDHIDKAIMGELDNFLDMLSVELRQILKTKSTRLTRAEFDSNGFVNGSYEIKNKESWNDSHISDFLF